MYSMIVSYVDLANNFFFAVFNKKLWKGRLYDDKRDACQIWLLSKFITNKFDNDTCVHDIDGE